MQQVAQELFVLDGINWADGKDNGNVTPHRILKRALVFMGETCFFFFHLNLPPTDRGTVRQAHHGRM